MQRAPLKLLQTSNVPHCKLDTSTQQHGCEEGAGTRGTPARVKAPKGVLGLGHRLFRALARRKGCLMPDYAPCLLHLWTCLRTGLRGRAAACCARALRHISRSGRPGELLGCATREECWHVTGIIIVTLRGITSSLAAVRACPRICTPGTCLQRLKFKPGPARK